MTCIEPKQRGTSQKLLSGGIIVAVVQCYDAIRLTGCFEIHHVPLLSQSKKGLGVLPGASNVFNCSQGIMDFKTPDSNCSQSSDLPSTVSDEVTPQPSRTRLSRLFWPLVAVALPLLALVGLAFWSMSGAPESKDSVATSKDRIDQGSHATFAAGTTDGSNAGSQEAADSLRLETHKFYSDFRPESLRGAPVIASNSKGKPAGDVN